MKKDNNLREQVISHMYMLYKFQTLMDRLVEETLKKQTGLTRAQYFVLLGIAKEPLSTQRTVAGILGISEVAVGKQLFLLEKNNLIKRKPMIWDKRSLEVSITPTGIETIRKSSKILQTKFESIFGEPQRNKLLAMDAEMAHMLQKLESFIQSQ